MRLPRLPIIASVVVLTAGALTGCGSSSSSSSSSGNATSSSSSSSSASGSSSASSSTGFTSQANQICANVNQKIAVLPRPTTLPQLQSIAQQESRDANAALRQLRGLTPPANQKQTFERYLSGVQKELVIVDQLARAAGRRDHAELRRLTTEGQARSRVDNAQATAIGLTDCAKNVSTGSAHHG